MIKRFNHLGDMQQHRDGDFVTYEDHAAEVARLNDLLATSQKEGMRLAGLLNGKESLIVRLNEQVRALDSFKLAFNDWHDKTDWVQTDKRFDVLLPWGKHRADVLREYIDRLEWQVRELAAESAIQDFIISGVKELVRDSEGVAGWHLNGDIASWDEVLPELNHSETPATDAILNEVGARAIDAYCDEMERNGVVTPRDFAARIRAGEVQ